MQAIVVRRRGGPEVFELAEVPVPEPGPDQVRLKVAAAALNYSDLQIAGAFYPGHASAKLPYVAGREAAGTVDALGADVEGLELGDAVMALGVRGAFAEYALCRPASVAPVPEGVDFPTAAGLLLQHYAAIAALETCAGLRCGERVLIHAAAGKVGQAMVALAKHLGAEVFATASTAAKLEVARERGADHIDYVAGDFAAAVSDRTGGAGVDVAVDTVGGEVLRRTLAVMRPYGRLVTAGNSSNQAVTFSHYELLSTHRCALIPLELGTLILERPDLMSEVRRRFDELRSGGVLAPPPPASYPLRDGPEALRRLAGRSTIGGVVLVPG